MAAAPDSSASARRGPVDYLLAAAVILLVGFGVVMVYSASAVYAERAHEDARYFLTRQAIWAGLGLAVMAVAARVGLRVTVRLIQPLLVVTLLLLVVVLTPLGTEVGGASRWLRIGGLTIQPGELAKVALVAWLASSLARKAPQIKSFKIGFLPHVMVAGLMIVLCVLEPDLGTAVLIGLVTGTLLFVAGGKVLYLLGTVITAAPVLYVAIVSSSYRMARIRAFYDPFAHRFEEGYQVTQSLLSFGAGGTFGLGLGDGRQKLFFLPEAYNDFIVPIIGEELGYVGICAMLAVYALVVWRGLRVALRRPGTFTSFLAFGVTTLIGMQALMNVAVAMGLLPTKGLNLPFVSYGGSSLVLNLLAVGLLLDASRGGSCPLEDLERARARRAEREKRGRDERPARVKPAPEAA